MGFSSEQIDRVRPLWDRMLGHRFLLETRDGTLPGETFAAWMRQDYLFVEAAVPFVGALVARAPAAHVEPLANVLQALHRELGLFQERAAAVGVDLRGAPPAFTCHAYVQFLLATAYRSSYAEAFTVLYAAEKAYHDSWKVVEDGLDPASPWRPFVENWAGEAFAGYVAWLEGELDGLAAQVGPDERNRMAELFRLTTLYEIAFWEMAVTGESWPGVHGAHPAIPHDGTEVGTEAGPEAGAPGAARPVPAWEGVVPPRDEES